MQSGILCLSQYIPAAVTKYLGVSDLYIIDMFFTVLEIGKLKIKVLVDPVSLTVPKMVSCCFVLACWKAEGQSALCPHVAKRRRRSRLSKARLWTVTPLSGVEPSWPDHLPQGPISMTLTLRTKFQGMNSGGIHAHRSSVCSDPCPLLLAQAFRVLVLHRCVVSLGPALSCPPLPCGTSCCT